MLIADAIEKMTAFYNGNLHDIHHFLKVWAWAKTIGEQEKLTPEISRALDRAKILAEIEDIYHIERGYEKVVEKFRKLGAQIEKVVEPD